MSDDQVIESQDEALAVEETESLVPEEEVASEPASGQAQLIVKRNGAETDVVFPIFGSAVIGRFDPNVGPIDVDLGSLPEGSYVSRKHAKINFEDGAWTLQDLGSSNGTYVLNGDFERVEIAELSDGTEFALGNARFIFKLA